MSHYVPICLFVILAALIPWKEGTPFPSSSTGLKSAYNPRDIGDHDCRDFATQGEAQAFFRAAGSADPHRLDHDGDGIACGSNFR